MKFIIRYSPHVQDNRLQGAISSSKSEFARHPSRHLPLVTYLRLQQSEHLGQFCLNVVPVFLLRTLRQDLADIRPMLFLLTLDLLVPLGFEAVPVARRDDVSGPVVGIVTLEIPVAEVLWDMSGALRRDISMKLSGSLYLMIEI